MLVSVVNMRLLNHYFTAGESAPHLDRRQEEHHDCPSPARHYSISASRLKYHCHRHFHCHRHHHHHNRHHHRNHRHRHCHRHRHRHA